MEEFYYVLFQYLQGLDKNIYEKYKSVLQNEMKELDENPKHKKLIGYVYDKLIKSNYVLDYKNNKIYKLKSILSIVDFHNGDKDDKGYNEKLKQIYRSFSPAELSNIYIYPQEEDSIDSTKFISHMDSFVNEIKICKNNEQKFYVAKKYFSCIPVQNSSDCYVSLFNVYKIISAVYSCLKNINDEKDLENQRFSLVKADFSGIQEFIFSITSKDAAKSLKGRSVYINLLMNIISKYIIKKLGLTKNNILYNGGGNFYILIPESKTKEIKSIREYISKVLLKAHKGKIYVAIGTSNENYHIHIDDLKNISKAFNDVSQETAYFKNKKWSDIGIEENFKSIFGPVDNGNAGNKVCSICGSKLDNNDEDMCYMCKSFSKLTNEIKMSDFYYEKEIEEATDISIKDFNSVFRCFGYEVKFANKNDEAKYNDFRKYIINKTEFLKNNCDGYIFGAFNLPDESTFEKLVLFNLNGSSNDDSIGDNKLGVLKLDVDNLGKIFMKGLNSYFQNHVSIGKIIELSNAIGLFFEGYLNELIKSDGDKGLLAGKKIKGRNWDKVMYTVYAGGDDTFILGAYNEIFEFSYILRKSFEKYACNNKKLTFSAGLGLFPYKYPVIKCAQYTEQFLDDAKSYTKENEELPQKNSVSLFGEVFRWDEFEKILEIRNLCIDIYKESNGNRAFLQKILNSTKGFRSIMNDISTKDKIEIAKVHRLAYYLRELRNKNNSKLKEDVEQLIKEYEDMVIKSILSKTDNVYNIMIIPAAVRWAELNTKKVREGDE